MKYLIVLALFLSAGKAFATDGNLLLSVCASADKTEWTEVELQNLNACNWYISGILDADDMWHALMKSDGNSAHNKSRICPATDDALSTNQLARVVLKYLKEHPAELHLPGSLLVHNALHSAFPCSGTKP